MKRVLTTLVGVVITLCLGCCLSSSVPYLPASNFECRLSVWPTFEPPVEFLVQKDSLGHSTITEFRYKGAGGYGPKRSGSPIVHAIDAKQWGDFADALREHDPWSIPTKQPYMSGLDGTTMILEIRDGDRFHRVQRWGPFAHKSEKKLVEFSTAIIRLLPDSR
jgi:hypothetical protein